MGPTMISCAVDSVNMTDIVLALNSIIILCVIVSYKGDIK
jgi:hypothetical protein